MNAPLQLVQTQIVRNAQMGDLRQFRLSEAIEGVGKAGELITLAVTPADTADQLAVIDNWISGFRNLDMTADIVAPVVLVDREAGKRIDRTLASAFTVLETAIGRQGHINEIQDAASRVDYKTQEYGLAAFIPWASENDAIPQYDIRRATSQMLADLVLLSREVRVWNFVTTLTNFNAANRTSLTTNFKWDNGSTKTPRLDVHTRVSASAQKITGMGMNPDVAFWFLGDTDVRAYLKHTMGDAAPNPDMARGSNAEGAEIIRLVGLPDIYICPAKKLSGANLVYVLADDVVLFSNPPGMPTDMFSVTTAKTFRTKGKSGVGWVNNEYIPNGRGLNSGRMLETGFGEVTFMGSDRAGGLIKDVLST
jgi:hypothetical protein